LHDIGKIGISDRILLKPDRLADDEFAIMKKHATIGAEILEHMYARTPSLSYLRYAKMIAAYHHERYDGGGYPYGLTGENIPLCGRIMAVADVYDALVEERVYRKKLSHTEAYLIVMDGKGRQFDPNVVDAFKAVYDKYLKNAG
jgi:putative two-component system response regulator